MNIREIIEGFNKTSEFTNEQAANLLSDYELRSDTITYLRQNPIREFALEFLKLLVHKRANQDYGTDINDHLITMEDLMFASYLVGIHGCVVCRRFYYNLES